MINRRQWLKGVAALVASVTAGLTIDSLNPAKIPQAFIDNEWRWLTPEEAFLLSLFMMPFYGSEQSNRQLLSRIEAVDQLALYLPEHELVNLRELLSALLSSLGRLVVGRQWRDWDEVDNTQLTSMLSQWQQSSLGLLNTAYNGVKELLIGVHYADPEIWPAIGYPGPPKVGL